MFWNKNTHKLSAVCDIGSASVSVAYVLHESGSKPTIIRSVRVPVSIQATPETELENAVLRYLDTAFLLISKQKSRDKEFEHILRKIDTVYVFFSSPWFVSKIRDVVLQKEKPFLLKKDSIEDLVKDEELKFQQDVLQGKYEHVPKCETTAIEREIVNVTLNGYEISNPYMKEAREAELTLFMSVVQSSILSKIKTLCEKHMHTNTISCHTFPLASFGVVRSLYPHETNFIVLDIAGETTDITTIESFVLKNTRACTLGRNLLVRNVCNVFGVTPEIACSFLSMYQNNTLDVKSRTIIERTTQEFTAEWTKSVWRSELSQTELSQKIFLTCDAEVRDIIISALHTLGFSTIISLGSESFKEVVASARHIEQDPFLILETAFLSIHGFA